MKQPGWQTSVGLVALLIWSGSVCSQSVDTSMARAMVDQPLSMSVQVRGFDWPASRLTPDCLQVEIQQGESGEAIAPLRVRTVPSGEDGRVAVQISSPQNITDTVLTGRLSLLCGADYTREFTVLVDPPSLTSTTNNARPKRLVTPTVVAPVKPVTALSAMENVRPAESIHAARNVTRSDDPPPPVGTPGNRTLDDAEVQRLVSAVVSAMSLTPQPAQAAALPVELSWQDLRDEQRQTRTAVAALQARIERKEHDVWRDALLVAGGILGLAAGLLALRLVREAGMPWIGTSDAAAAHRQRRQRTRSRQDADPLPTLTSIDRAAPASNKPDPGTVHWSDPTVPPASPAPTVAPALRWPDADFGHPSLDTVAASTELLQELDLLVAESPIGVAVVLERRLQELPGKCPWILLRLLDLYRQMAQPWNHERVAAQLEALYNVRIPAMESDDASDGSDLDAYPDTLGRILQVWPLDDPAATLTDLLLRPTVIEVLDQPAFEATLLLHGIVRQRQTAWLTAVDCGSTQPSTTPAHVHPPSGSSRLMELLAA
jgi:hypothetical protein